MTDTASVPARHRLFFALWPDERLAAGLGDIAMAAARQYGGRATRRDTLHLTLAFLGELAETDIDRLIAAARRVHAEAFNLRIDRLGHWRHNRLLWAGCEPSFGLATLAGALRGQLADSGFAVEHSEQAFTPHLTLVRKLPPGEISPELAEFSPAELPIWRCTRFLLLASRLSAAGARYEIMAEFPLVAGDGSSLALKP